MKYVLLFVPSFVSIVFYLFSFVAFHTPQTTPKIFTGKESNDVPNGNDVKRLTMRMYSQTEKMLHTLLYM